MFFFFFQAEDGIRDHCVTGVQTCALPIFSCPCPCGTVPSVTTTSPKMSSFTAAASLFPENWRSGFRSVDWPKLFVPESDRKSTRLNSSHTVISYAVFCLKKKKNHKPNSSH